MIGSKKLRTIREDLQRALAATGDDPLCWLEARMATPPAQSEVAQSLRRFLDAGERPRRQRKRVGTKK